MIQNSQEACRSGKQILTVSLNLPSHKVYIIMKRLSVTQNKRYHELYQERIIDSYSILSESVIRKPNIKFSGTTETLVLTLMYSKT